MKNNYCVDCSCHKVCTIVNGAGPDRREDRCFHPEVLTARDPVTGEILFKEGLACSRAREDVDGSILPRCMHFTPSGTESMPEMIAVYTDVVHDLVRFVVEMSEALNSKGMMSPAGGAGVDVWMKRLTEGERA